MRGHPRSGSGAARVAHQARARHAEPDGHSFEGSFASQPCPHGRVHILLLPGTTTTATCRWLHSGGAPALAHEAARFVRVVTPAPRPRQRHPLRERLLSSELCHGELLPVLEGQALAELGATLLRLCRLGLPSTTTGQPDLDSRRNRVSPAEACGTEQGLRLRRVPMPHQEPGPAHVLPLRHGPLLPRVPFARLLDVLRGELAALLRGALLRSGLGRDDEPDAPLPTVRGVGETGPGITVVGDPSCLGFGPCRLSDARLQHGHDRHQAETRERSDPARSVGVFSSRLGEVISQASLWIDGPSNVPNVTVSRVRKRVDAPRAHDRGLYHLHTGSVIRSGMAYRLPPPRAFPRFLHATAPVGGVG